MAHAGNERRDGVDGGIVNSTLIEAHASTFLDVLLVFFLSFFEFWKMSMIMVLSHIVE